MPRSPTGAGFRTGPGPTSNSDDATAAERLAEAGFVEVETGLEPAPTAFPGPAEFREFVAAVVLRAHLARIGEAAARESLLDRLLEMAGGDDPPHLLDYWRLNLRARVPA